MLDDEIKFYEDHRSEWLQSMRHRFVLVKGAALVGDFDTVEDALREGVRRFGLQPFLVRRVEAAEEDVSIPALTLGLISANPTFVVDR